MNKMRCLLFLFLVGCAENRTSVEYADPVPTYQGCQKSMADVPGWQVSCFICPEKK